MRSCAACDRSTILTRHSASAAAPLSDSALRLMRAVWSTFILASFLAVLLGVAAPAKRRRCRTREANVRRAASCRRPSSGTVTVRVVRGTMTNVIAGQPVELTGGPSPLSAKTNDAGRAEFSGLQPGTKRQGSRDRGWRAPRIAGVLDSRDRRHPCRSRRDGSRDAAARGADRQAAESTAQSGTVVLGEQSRFIFEMGEEALNCVRASRHRECGEVPVKTAQPVDFRVCPRRCAASGFSRRPRRKPPSPDKRVIVKGPFAPGTTSVQFGYSLPISGGSLTWSRRCRFRSVS